MSNWFNILYGNKEPVESSRPSPSEQLPDINSPLVSEDANSPQSESQPIPKGSVNPAPPLPKMPSRWVLELQKTAFHLSQEESGKSGSRIVAFSGMQNGSGASTISFLIAHYLAVVMPEIRVLYAEYDIEKKHSKRHHAEEAIHLGQPIPEDFLTKDPQAFTRVSIQPAKNGSVVNSSRWFRDFLEKSTKHCDWIIVDMPPFFSAPESYTFAQLCDGVVFILKSGETRHPALNGLVSDLEQVGIRVLGTILNFRQYPIPPWLLKFI